MMPAPSFSLSQNAAKRLKTMTGGQVPVLRVHVSGGGCSGFQYGFSLETSPPTGEDSVLETHGCRVLVDEASLPFLVGAQIDYVEDLMGASFRVKNPNAQSSCGGGNSFAI